MKSIQLKERVFTVALAGLLLSLTSCSTKFAFANSPVVPAARGSVNVDKDQNKNYKIVVDVTNLAEPKRLSPPKSVYVLWMQTDRSAPINLGQLSTSSGFFSSTLKASLRTVNPNKPTGFFITAEDNAGVQYPGSQVVLRTDS